MLALPRSGSLLPADCGGRSWRNGCRKTDGRLPPGADDRAGCRAVRLFRPVATVAIVVCCMAGCAAGPSLSRTGAGELAREALIVDTHIDVPYRVHRSAADVSAATEDGDFDYPRAVSGGLDAMFMSIYVPAAVDAAGDAGKLAHELIDDVEALAARAPDRFALAHCADDVVASKASGRIALPMGLENGAPVAGDIANLDALARRGIRYITLAHSKSNHISDSSYDSNEQWQGLSPFGRRLVGAMNDRGIIVDVSHLSDRAFWQVLELSSVPVIASHSSLRHFTPGFHRNMSDAMVAALGEQGGVIQINFGSGFLTQAARDWSAARAEAVARYREQNHLQSGDSRLTEYASSYRDTHPYPRATVDDVLDHIDRAVRLAGIDHVGIGSDYDGVGDTLPVGLEDVSTYPNLVRGLAARGYDERAIRKILGDNVMRVWRAVEAAAEQAGHPVRCVL